MNIYLAIKYHSDNQNKTFIEQISQHFENQGHSIICAARDFENWGAKSFDPQQLLFMAFKAIEKSDLVLIEATEKGMGVGIEAGFSYARNIPIITIAKQGSDISSNLRSLSQKVLIYTSPEELSLSW